MSNEKENVVVSVARIIINLKKELKKHEIFDPDISFKTGAHWQRNDPAFIADIVREALDSVSKKSYPVATTHTSHLGVGKTNVHLAVPPLKALHPDIVNQILNKKL